MIIHRERRGRRQPAILDNEWSYYLTISVLSITADGLCTLMANQRLCQDWFCSTFALSAGQPPPAVCYVTAVCKCELMRITRVDRGDDGLRQRGITSHTKGIQRREREYKEQTKGQMKGICGELWMLQGAPMDILCNGCNAMGKVRCGMYSVARYHDKSRQINTAWSASEKSPKEEKKWHARKICTPARASKTLQ